MRFIFSETSTGVVVERAEWQGEYGGTFALVRVRTELCGDILYAWDVLFIAPGADAGSLRGREGYQGIDMLNESGAFKKMATEARRIVTAAEKKEQAG